MSKKLFAFAFLFFIVFISIWYLFIKDYNYRIRFETTQPAGAVYATLADWHNLIPSKIDSVSSLSKNPFNEVGYTLFKSDSIFKYRWEIERLNDSTTAVSAFIKDEVNSLKQNINVPFFKTDFVHSNVVEVRKIMRFLKELSDVYNLEVKQDSTYNLKPKYCAFVSVKSTISGKATAMYENIAKVMGYVRSNDIELNGDPFVSVTDLNLETSTIEFDFCFPIIEKDSMPKSNVVKFKTTPNFEAIKAVYNGNYRSTEYAWFELIDYAQRNNIDFIPKPMEIYKNDPQSGTDSNEWIAEVYLPIK